jgi:hypothetical protein
LRIFRHLKESSEAIGYGAPDVEKCNDDWFIDNF